MALFMTRGMSLSKWAELGMLQRELALYRWYASQGWKVVFVSYGDASDGEILRASLPQAAVCANLHGLDGNEYAESLLEIHGDTLRTADVFKTNQTSGSREALHVAKGLDKPLVARCGYLLSTFMRHMHGPDSAPCKEAMELEAEVFSRSRLVIVTTREMADDVRMRIPDARIAVVPNYVVPEHFPARTQPPDYDLCFVGRLHPQKNVLALLEALEHSTYRCLLIGDGELRDAAAVRIRPMQDRVHWIPSVPHERLHEYISRARVFILPSRYEGHPKTLLEAMCLGLPVIGTKAPGITPILEQSRGGWLTGSSAGDIRAAIDTAMASPAERAKRGKLSRQFANVHFALEVVAPLESRQILSCIPGN
jgi:glycosyltransferase involved in cell wall biosynthesis